MNVVDSSGWLEYFGVGANADFFAPAIRDTENLLVPSVCIYEVFKRMLAQRGEEDALKAAGFMSLGTTVDLTRDIAIHAAQISTERKLAMADSVMLATAYAYNATLWTQDGDFEGIEGVGYVQK
jgi:toxin FitB